MAASLLTSLLGLLVLLVLLVLLSPGSAESIDPSVVDLASRNADFATQLYRAVARRTDDSIVLCPFALSGGLLALLSAAGGPTRDQLLQGLTLNGLDAEALPDLLQSLRNVVLRGGSALQQGAAIFPAQNFQVSPSYLSLVQTKLGATAQTLAYASPHEAVAAINGWAQQKTGDKVQDLMSHLDPQTQLLVATAASYQTHFSPPFNSSFTQDERFFVDRYHVAMVPMMFRADKYFLAYDGSVKAGVLKLPMADGSAMLAVLPDDEVDIGTVEEELTAEKIQSWIRQLKKTRLEVQLPRFLLQRSYSLKDVLQSLSIMQVFEDDADLSKMGGAGGASAGSKVTQVHQKSVISTDETTTDATAGGGVPVFSTPPPRLTFNRPFIFIIYHQATSSLLLLGRVSDPSPN